MGSLRADFRSAPIHCEGSLASSYPALPISDSPTASAHLIAHPILNYLSYNHSLFRLARIFFIHISTSPSTSFTSFTLAKRCLRSFVCHILRPLLPQHRHNLSPRLHSAVSHHEGAMQPSFVSLKDGKSQIQIPWRSIQLLVPHRLRRKIRSKLRNRQSPASSVSALQTSLSPAETLRSLQQHEWTWHDGQWVILAFLGIFSLSIIESPGPMAKMMVATVIGTSLILPITRQFFLPFMPIAAYLIWFYSAR